MTPTGWARTWSRRSLASTLALLVAVLLLAGCATRPPDDPLPSWNDGPVKAAIVKLVDDTTRPGSPDFVPEAERIATFDNDGTLWAEHPMYVEVVFTEQRIRDLAPQHPEWSTRMPYQAVLGNDPAAMAHLTGAEFFELVGATRAGYTSEQVRTQAAAWLAQARHPRFGRLYTELVYQPMLEVLAYFRAHGYKTFIVSGGTLDFIRAFAEKAYDIPPEQVVGTSYRMQYAFVNDVAANTSTASVMLIDDGPGKATGIDHSIGRVPIAAFGNSDGDLEMLETTTRSSESARGKRLAAFVWHTDAVREYAYDRDTTVGRLDRGLSEAPRLGWLLIDMKRDWKVVFPFEVVK